MDYIINEEILDWINSNKLPANNPENENNFSYDDVGDWDGEEELAIQNLNWIMLMLESEKKPVDNKHDLTSLKKQVWRDWCEDTRILDATEKDISDYVKKVTYGWQSKLANNQRSYFMIS